MTTVKQTKKKLIVKNAAGRSGVGAWVKEQILHHYENELELDCDKLAEEARKKFHGKTNAKCVRWYINDLEKKGEINR